MIILPSLKHCILTAGTEGGGISTFEMVNALRFYKTGMNLLDIASYVQANRWIFAFTFIFANLVLFPSALFFVNGICKEMTLQEVLLRKV